MKFGDVVQIKQSFQGQPHWIYARVHSADPSGGATVVISHPQNPEDGKTIMVAAEDIRTKEDLQKLHDAIPDQLKAGKISGQAATEERRVLASQMDTLS